MKAVVQRFARKVGCRDFIVGDIHGHFTRLQKKLDAIGFNPARGDRLFSVGDLVDRGPESDEALDWLARPWFHAVLGNHEHMAIMWDEHRDGVDPEWYIRNGGAWNVFNPRETSAAFADAFRELPVAIELETNFGTVGIVHADCPLSSWREFTAAMQSRDHEFAYGARNTAIWSRERIKSAVAGRKTERVEDVRAVVVGHNEMAVPQWIDNVLHIETSGWRDAGSFTVINADTLSPAVEIKGE